MTETPDQMVRRVLADLYPRPNPWAGFAEAARGFARAAAVMTAALRLTPTEPCRLCGCWGGHHDGCPLGERC